MASGSTGYSLSELGIALFDKGLACLARILAHVGLQGKPLLPAVFIFEIAVFHAIQGLLGQAHHFRALACDHGRHFLATYAGTEAAPVAAQHDDAHRAVAAKCVEFRRERMPAGAIERIHRRLVDHQFGYTVGDAGVKWIIRMIHTIFLPLRSWSI